MPIATEAVVFPAPGQVEIWPVTVPDPGPDEVLMRTVYSGISQGTERWMLLGRYDRMGEQPAANYPCFPGYQAAGVVEAVGAAVADLRPGDRVLTVGTCLADPALNRRGRASHVGRLVAPRGEVARLGPAADLAVASLFVMAAVGRHGVRLSGVRAGERVLVVGQGLIGQMAAQAARRQGARVIATDLIAARVALSARHSADRAERATTEELAALVAEEAPGGVDLVIDTTGNSRLFAQLLPLIRREGRICLQGYYPDPVVIDFHQAHLQRVSVIFPCGWDRERDQELADDLSRGAVTLAPLITHRLPARAAPEAYRLVVEDPAASLGMVLAWDNTA
jgi:3-hydroxyethyl bacteriochlorophyllide a dehydrogenase